MAHLVKIALLLTLICATAWALIAPGFESVVAALTSFAALIGSLSYPNKSDAKNNQNQNISNSSRGIQAGGNVGVNVQLGAEKK